jgi:hypothetical protein
VEKFINIDRDIIMSTKLQAALCMMTVGMEALCSRQAGFSNFKNHQVLLVHPVDGRVISKWIIK